MASPEKNWRPVVILGAGRSGTNMLRDILTGLPGYATWPCDEINYIWRHGSRNWPDDRIPEDRANQRYQQFLTRKFQRLHKASGCHNLVEKTCANTLRVPFVNRALPSNALFIEIVRDGRDVVASAMKRWTASLDLRYILRKARYVPVGDLPYYAFRYLGARLHRLRSQERRLSSWGPKYPGMADDLSQLSLPELCAKQWAICVDTCRNDLEQLDGSRWIRLKYEDFVTNPKVELARIGSFLGESWSPDQITSSVQSVSPRSVGAWKRSLDESTASLISNRHRNSLAAVGAIV